MEKKYIVRLTDAERETCREVMDGKQEAKLMALRLGKPPQGFANWSLRLPAEKAVELEIVDAVSHETVRAQVLSCLEHVGLRLISCLSRCAAHVCSVQVIDVVLYPC